jgi:hypothetical protein
VRDTGLPALQGRYLYGDFCTGRLRSFVPDVAGQRALNDSALGVTILRLSSIGKGWGGQVYLTDSTRLYRLEP